MSRAQREKSQSRANFSEKHFGKWIGGGYKEDSERALEKRKKRGAFNKNRYLDRNMDFLEFN